MAEAKKDNNSINTMQGVLNTDGATPTNITADPTTHLTDVMHGTGGSDLGNDDAARDDNSVPVLLATSNADGETPVPLYVNSSGQLLIKAT